MESELVLKLQQLKENVGLNKCNDLENSFYIYLDEIFSSIDEVYSSDLSEFQANFIFLIDEVISIFNSEKSDINKEIFLNNLNIKAKYNELEDGKRALDMYVFNDVSFENYLIGDIHSDSISLDKILSKVSFFKRIKKHDKFRLIFLGDYVDRGQAQLKTMFMILLLKYLFPEYIYLLKGNHDTGVIVENKITMGVRKPEEDSIEAWYLLFLEKIVKNNKTLTYNVIYKIVELFNHLATLGFILNKNYYVFLTHGGIPRPNREIENIYEHIKSMSDLTNKNIIDILGNTIVSNMLWSDPTEGLYDLYSEYGRFEFTKLEFLKFKEIIGFDLLVRGHEVQEPGYKYYFDKKLINIFSSGTILEKDENINNESAYVIVMPHIIKVNHDNIDLIDLNR